MDKEIILDDENLEKLKNFKEIFEVILGEKFEFNDYVNSVISIGLDKMLRDAIPEGQEWNTLNAAFNEKYDFMCNLVTNIWKRGAEVSDEERKTIASQQLITGLKRLHPVSAQIFNNRGSSV